MLYRHFMYPAKGGSIPSRIVAVDADCTRETVEGRAVREVEHLTRWYAAGWSEGRDRVQRDWEGHGETAQSCWEAVDWGLARPGKTYVVSWCAARVWGLLGLWERIENGSVRIAGIDGKDPDRATEGGNVSGVPEGPNADRSGQARGDLGGVRSVPGGLPDQRNNTGDGRSRSRHGGGCAVLEDPPSVIVARVPGREGTLVILDARNYGLDGFPSTAPVSERARWLRAVMRRMVAVIRENGWGGLATTAGAQAMTTFRHRYLTHTIQCHARPEALALEDAALYGGRCECRRIGDVKGDVYHVDFRSLYPSICARLPLPALLLSPPHDGAPGGGWAQKEGEGVIAQVEIETDEPAYPLRRRADTIWPIGRFVTTLCGPELLDAHQRGRIRQWRRHATYGLSTCLSAYSTSLYAVLSALRKNGNGPLTGWLKRLLVSLPGKFAQRGWTWVDHPRSTCPFGPWVQWWETGIDGPVRCRSLGWQAQREKRDSWSGEAMPAISAWVNSAGRMALLDAIRCAGWREVHYYDTDSLLVTATGYAALCAAGRVRPDALGYLRLLGHHDRCSLLGVKHYILDGVRTCSGLPRGTVEPCERAGWFWYRDDLKSCARSGQRPTAARTMKSFARTASYKGGAVLKDGTVEPWRIGGDT